MHEVALTFDLSYSFTQVDICAEFDEIPSRTVENRGEVTYLLIQCCPGTLQ